MWSYGDGGLIKKFPELTYKERMPNSAENMFSLISATAITIPLITFNIFPFGYLSAITFLDFFLKAAASIILADVTHEIYCHLICDATELAPLRAQLPDNDHPQLFWVLACMESALIRMASECGKLAGLLRRQGEWKLIGRRFDWFAGTGRV
jgi:hypothetical protein